LLIDKSRYTYTQTLSTLQINSLRNTKSTLSFLWDQANVSFSEWLLGPGGGVHKPQLTL